MAAESGLESILAVPDFLPPPAGRDRGPTAAADLERFLAAADVALLVVLHAFKCGAVLDQAADLACDGNRTSAVPTVLVLGGTDVNVDATSAPDKAETLTRRAAAVDRVVAFATSMLEAAPPGSLPPHKTRIIPQGVSLPSEVDPTPEGGSDAPEDEAEAMLSDESSRIFSSEESVPRTPPTHSGPSLHAALGLPATVPVMLLPAGLRPVKDVLWALDAVERAAAGAASPGGVPSSPPSPSPSSPTPTHPPFVLAIVGPVLDPAYAEAVDARLVGARSVVRLPPVERRTMVRYMADAAAVVNTSESEGQSGALLEAAAVGTPIVARDIPGNRSLLDLVHGSAENAAVAAAGAAFVSYGDSSSRCSRDARGSVLDLESYEVHPCGVLCPTPEAFAAAIVDAFVPVGKSSPHAGPSGGVDGVSAAVCAAARRARVGADGLAAFERHAWTNMVREVVGERCGAKAGKE